MKRGHKVRKYTAWLRDNAVDYLTSCTCNSKSYDTALLFLPLNTLMQANSMSAL